MTQRPAYERLTAALIQLQRIKEQRNRLRIRITAKDAALRAAIALIEKPAKRHADENDPALAGLTGTPRYSAGLRVHHRECHELLPVLRAALGDA